MCGCFVPLPACSFYRVAHRPISKRVFEIVQCPHWIPRITFDIELVLFGKKKTLTRSMKPYILENIDEFNITTISLQKPANSIVNKRFAIANDMAFALPNHFKVPVECNSKQQAAEQFATCTNRIRCECETSVQSCQCPEDSVRTLYGDGKVMMPLQTPYGRIRRSGDDIITISQEEELILRIDSKIIKESATLVERLGCDLQVETLSGCYDCPQGANLTVTCTSSSNGVVTAVCETQQFSFSCETSTKVNWILLEFQKSIIREHCTVPCGPLGKSFIMEGILHYHIESNRSIFELDSHTVPINTQWFSDITLPDMEPLIKVIKLHWKFALGALGTALTLGTLTYVFGPTVIICLLKVGLNVLSCAAGIIRKILCSFTKPSSTSI